MTVEATHALRCVLQVTLRQILMFANRLSIQQSLSHVWKNLPESSPCFDA